MQIPNKLIEFLNQNHVKYEVLHHPARFTAQELAQVEGVKGRAHAKVVMVKRNGAHYMTVLPSDRRIDMDRLESTTGPGSEIENEPEFTPLFPDCETGTMPPFGNLYGLPTYVDQSLADSDMIVFEAGTHTDAVRMRYSDYEKLVHPTVAEFAWKAA